MVLMVPVPYIMAAAVVVAVAVVAAVTTLAVVAVLAVMVRPVPYILPLFSKI
jgi:hypothetical protein